MKLESRPTCPECGAATVYKYGKTSFGTQRYLWRNANAGLAPGSKENQMKNRIRCPGCNAPMYVYKVETSFTRYRCSEYPECRTCFKQIRKGRLK